MERPEPYSARPCPHCGGTGRIEQGRCIAAVNGRQCLRPAVGREYANRFDHIWSDEERQWRESIRPDLYCGLHGNTRLREEMRRHERAQAQAE